MKLSDKILQIEHSPIRKFYAYAGQAEAKGRKVYYLNIGQPDIRTPDVFFDSIRSFSDPVLAYAPSEGTSSLLEAVAAYYRRHGVPFEKEDLIITHGGSEALTFVMTALLDPEDEVILPEPFYANNTVFIGLAGGKVVPLTTRAENGYRYADPKAIEKRITDRTKSMLIVNPGNPTGTVLTRQEMKMLCDLAKKHDFYIVADEVYREFVYDGKEMESFGRFPEVADRVVIIDSISKRFSACGARIGSIGTKNRLLYDNLMKLAQGRLSCSTVAQDGAAALYRLDPSYFNEVREEYQARRDVVFEALSRIPGIVCQKPDGAFYITCRLPVADTEAFLVWLLTEFEDNNETVMFAPAGGFYGTRGLGRDEIRIAYVLNREDMIRGVELIRMGLERYGGGR